jgi:hypothetical protein
MELAGAHMRQRRIELREAELRMAAKQPGHLQARSAIGHVGEIEVPLLVHLEAQEVRRRSRLVGGIAELAPVRLGPGDELGEVAGRHAWRGDEHQRRLDAADDRVKLVDRPARVGKRVGRDLGERLGAEPDDGAVRRLIDDVLRRDVTARARLVLDDDRLPQRPRHVLGDHAGVGFDRAARRGPDDDPDRPALRPCRGGGEARQQSGYPEQRKPREPQPSHGDLPGLLRSQAATCPGQRKLPFA